MRFAMKFWESANVFQVRCLELPAYQVKVFYLCFFLFYVDENKPDRSRNQLKVKIVDSLEFGDKTMLVFLQGTEN